MMASAYEYLRTTRPFAGWRLPHADEVEFHVTRHRDRDGDHCMYPDGTHRIRASAPRVTTTDSLMQLIAHELIHLYQDGILKSRSSNPHDKQFHRFARAICRIHGWEHRSFAPE